MPYKDVEKRRAYQRKNWRKYQDSEKKSKRVSARRRRIQQWLAEYKSSLACESCSENHPACLDFHHKNPAEKSGFIQRLISDGCSIQRLQKEIAKCSVLCANCHRKLHWEEKQLAQIDDMFFSDLEST